MTTKDTRSSFYAWSRPLLLALLVVGGALLIASSGRAQEDAPAGGGAVRAAVVNVDEVLAQSEQWRDAAEERAAMAERKERVLKPLDRQRRALAKAVHDYPIGTQDRREAEQALREKDMEYQSKRAEFDRQIREQFADSYRAILNEIEQAVARHCREHNLQLVLKTGSPADLDDERDLLDVHTQQVIYADPGLDISGRIIQMLNAAYEAPIKDN